MTDPETITRLGAKDSDLSRATQALKDAAVGYAAIRHARGLFKEKTQHLDKLIRAAEDYADVYLRGAK